MDGPALVAAATQVPVVVFGGARLVVGEHLGVAIGGRCAVRRGRRGRRAAPPVGATGRRRGRRRRGAALGQRLVQPEPEEAVVAGLAHAVRAELRPALEVVRRRGSVCASRTTGSRRSLGTASGRGASGSAVDRRPRPERRDVDERVRVEDLGQELDAVDDARTRPAEVGRAVEREDLAAPDGGQVLVARRAPASAPTRPASRPGGTRTASAGASRVHLADGIPASSGRDRSPSAPSSSQPPARRTCSGTQWPDANGGSSHSRADDAGRPAARIAPRLDLAVDRAQPLAERLDEVDRGVLRLGHRADRGDRVEDALDRRRLEGHDGDVGVDRPRDVVDLAVADRADAAQLLGQDEVGLRGGERLLVQRVERRAAVDGRGDQPVDVARRRRR